jgi:hypothetical protein
MVKKTIQMGLPLSGGGPTNPGYPTIFRPTPAAAPLQKPKPRAVLTTSRARWLIQLHQGPQASSHGKVQQDCMAVGWTEWVKDEAENYKEQLTPAGLSAIAHLFPTKHSP